MALILWGKTRGGGYSDIKTYADVSLQWVGFSQEIPKHFLQKYPSAWVQFSKISGCGKHSENCEKWPYILRKIPQNGYRC